MSPALLDTGAPTQNPNSNINIPTVSFLILSLPLVIIVISLKKVSIKTRNQMNPSNFGFSDSTRKSDQNSNFSSRSPSSSSTKGGISTPKLVKVRRQSDPQNFKSNEETCVGIGFSPFRPDTSMAGPGGSGSDGHEAFVFGASRSNVGFNSSSGKGIVEELKSLRAGSEASVDVSEKTGFVFASDGNKSHGVHESMQKLSFDDKEKVVDGASKFSVNGRFGGGDNVGSSFGRNVESLLPDELEKKVNTEEAGDATNGDGSFQADDIEKFGFKNSEKGSDMFAAAAADNALPDQIKFSKIKDYVVTNNINNETNEKDSFAFGSRESIDGYVGGENESTLSHEMGCKLKIGSAKGETSGQTNTGFSSRRISRKDVPTVNEGDKKLHDCGDPFGFFFEGGMPGKDVSDIHAPMDQPKVDTQPIGVPGPSLVFSSNSLAGWNAFRVPLTGGLEKTDGFGFTSKQDGAGSPFVEFKTPNPKGNLFTGLNPQMEFSTKFKDSKEKKKRGKSKQPAKFPLSPGLEFVIRKSGSHEIPEASESYAPTDISPFQETLSDVRNSRETSVTSEFFAQDSQHASTGSQPTVLNDAIDEDLVVATQRMDISEDVMKYRETKEENSENCFDKGFGAEIHMEECVTGAETGSFKSANEEIDSINDVLVTLAETEASSSTNLDSDLSTQFVSAVFSEDTVTSGFTFAASSTAQVSPKHHHKKNNLVRVDNDSVNSSATSKGSYASSSLQFTPFSGPSSPLSPLRSKKVGLSAPSRVLGDNDELHRGLGIDQGSVSASVAAQEACEKWRLRGNKAYTSGHLSKAEDCYTQGVNCVSKSETSVSCLRALMLCYSNRAATRMSLGRMRDALGDCKKAAAIDPNFIRVQVRAANCYLALGDVEGAVQYFQKCLQFGIDVCVDRKVAVEAADGLQKAQKVTECMQHSAELLRRGAPNDAESALQVIAEGLLISSCSEKLLKMKAESLFMLRKYEEVIQLCEHTFDFANKNSPPLHADYHAENNGPELTKDTSFMIWRCHLIFKSYFHLGRLEEAIGSLEKQVEPSSTATSSLSKIGIETQESLVLLAATVHKLMSHKAAGNEAFQAGKHSEAIEHYSAALSHNIESRPFAAICFCNRAAAYKALGQITDATADCSLAIALDGNYLKAISRRATLYEMIRDYGQAARDLQRLVAVLTNQVEEKTKQSGHSDRTTNLANDLRQACLRLSTIEEAARKEVPLNMYLILGIEPSASASEVKKAYHKAALRHHPDKAGQSLARSDNGDDSLWKEIGEEVHKDTDRLFKMIGEAYAMLSDPAKRAQYDLEEVMRNDLKKQSGSSTYRTHADASNFPFERSSRRQWKEGWRAYGR